MGLVGYPNLLTGWDLPNPAILGPALLNHPGEMPFLMKDIRFRYYLVTCDWMYDLFQPVFGEKTKKWYAGIEADRYHHNPPDLRDIDVLVYDKIRWNRETLVPQFMMRLERMMEARNLSYEIVEYGNYDHRVYLDQVARSRSMVFLCEHETQGMAYQEAMAADVPILAWDNGSWLDPDWKRFSSVPIGASSVPHFSERCGVRFKSPEDLEASFADFWSRLDSFSPRNYVEEHLSLRGSASIYVELVDSLMDSAQGSLAT